jgi:predicted TIM-barrel fold metal-dependent hydrolase
MLSGISVEEQGENANFYSVRFDGLTAPRRSEASKTESEFLISSRSAKSRRSFLTALASACAASLVSNLGAASQLSDIPIIDTHIHLFDTARPQGVPWPTPKDGVLYQPALPDRYRRIATPLGIVGAIEVEASPWLEDNQWVLDVAARDSIVVGTIGDLEPGKPEFREQLDRFHRNPLFRGIRYGNLWDRDLGAALAKPEFVAGLKMLASAGMVLDTANPTPALIADVVRVTDLVPSLRVVIDHLPQLTYPTSPDDLRTYHANLRELSHRPQVYVKVSEVLRHVDGKVPSDLNFYRPRIDELWDLFGQHRLLYGNDWPNSDAWAEYPTVLGLVREYFTAKGHAAAKSYFWKNSVAAYRWVKRDRSQPG